MIPPIDQAVAELRDFAAAARHSPEPAQAVADLALMLAEQTDRLMAALIALVPPDALAEMQQLIDGQWQAAAAATARLAEQTAELAAQVAMQGGAVSPIAPGEFDDQAFPSLAPVDNSAGGDSDRAGTTG